ncbi:radical SAM protein, partial [bacterium]|nr:radical SAM protein [bacterium]
MRSEVHEESIDLVHPIKEPVLKHCYLLFGHYAILSRIMKEICSFSMKDLKVWMEQNGEKAFRAAQVFDWIYAKDAEKFDAMTNIGKELRSKLVNEFSFPVLKLLRTQESEDLETIKFLWQLPDQKRIESVLILSGDRRTVCLSCQVGCPARCAFCASGKEGLLRNLSSAEIVEQVLHINRILKAKGERVSHLVFMGMGEPMENYDAVVKAIEIFHAEEGLGISQR